MFSSKNKENNVYLYEPKFYYYIKVGFKSEGFVGMMDTRSNGSLN